MITSRAPAGPPRGPMVEPRPARAGRRRRRWMRAAAGVLVLMVAVALIWFQPQKLLYDQRVDEVVPSAVGSVAGSGSAVVAAPRPCSPPARSSPGNTRPTERLRCFGWPTAR